MSAAQKRPTDTQALLAALRESDAGLADAQPVAEKLEGFLDLLLRWNRVYNLTAITDRAQMITHHLLDSLSILAPLDRVLSAHRAPQILDAGTGPGLPGIPLAVARPDWLLTLLDSNSKKTAFVTQAIAELDLANATAMTHRVERASGRYDVVVSRAFASLSDFTASTRALLGSNGTWAAMKGLLPGDEIAALPAGVKVVDIVPLIVPGLDAERHLILMKADR